MKTVYKFPLELNRRNNLSLPNTAKFVKFDVQGGILMCWYELDVQASRWPRNLGIFATGQEIPPSSNHLGTCLEGQFVWHLYEVE